MKARLPSRRALTVIGVVVTVAAGAVVWQCLPGPTDVFGPFDVHAEAGRAATGRAVSATVTNTRVTPVVDTVKPAGVWVVVDAALEGTRSTELPHSKLLVGPNTYDPSDRFFSDTLLAEISPGLTLTGSWVFDVDPAVAPGSSDPLTLMVWVGDGRLDSRLLIEIPTHGSRFSRVNEVTLNKPELSAS
ncbi:hypothetical protein [Mycobacterium sp. 1274761.0]|uniref:hypothetical protein n=1 Tax=Mycobacterium sp. 1274761.0 TaxID=1834077 RepID=UPI0007FDEBFB|nr:hypothetical protein [Mycobacterium sp. 1274761.0]OBK71440.1 hypothetical protein A5651_18560 [Mycobacterium sp. 1274761.0]